MEGEGFGVYYLGDGEVMVSSGVLQMRFSWNQHYGVYCLVASALNVESLNLHSYLTRNKNSQFCFDLLRKSKPAYGFSKSGKTYRLKIADIPWKSFSTQTRERILYCADDGQTSNLKKRSYASLSFIRCLNFDK